MCLMHLISEWLASSCGEGLPSVTAVTIDHRLRATSSAEATEVSRRAAALGLAHRVLAWTGAKPETGLQAEARAMRYRMLSEAATGEGRAAVVVAHTLDDQAETLIMRLKRGSGVDGLSGMAPVRALDRDIDLVRPLISVPRARIEATLRARSVTWIEDPSNDNPAFERVRVRKARGALDEIGLSNEMLALTARRAGRAHRALDAVTAEFLAREAALHNGAFASLDRGRFMAAPEDIRVRICDRLIRAFGDASEPALLSQVEAVADEISRGAHAARRLAGPSSRRASATSGSTESRASLGRPRAARARPSNSLGWAVLGVGGGSRGGVGEAFAVAPLAGGAASVDATLAEGGLSIPGFASGWPRQVLLGLPAIWTGSRLVAVPHFGDDQGTTRDFASPFWALGAKARWGVRRVRGANSVAGRKSG